RPDRIDRNAHVNSPTLPLGWLWRRLLRVVSTGLLRRRTRLPRLRHPTTRRELPTRWRTLRRLPRLRHPTTRRELPTGWRALRRRTRLPRLRHPTTRRELPTRWRALRREPTAGRRTEPATRRRATKASRTTGSRTTATRNSDISCCRRNQTQYTNNDDKDPHDQIQQRSAHCEFPVDRQFISARPDHEQDREQQQQYAADAGHNRSNLAHHGIELACQRQ